MAYQVLITDADAGSRTVLGRALRAGMMQTEAAASGEEALDRLARAEYDLLILGIDLPGIDGFHVIQTVRRRGSRIPIMVVSSHDEDYEQLYALDLGADDYITKPFNPVILAAKACLWRRSSPPGPSRTTAVRCAFIKTAMRSCCPARRTR